MDSRQAVQLVEGSRISPYPHNNQGLWCSLSRELAHPNGFLYETHHGGVAQMVKQIRCLKAVGVVLMHSRAHRAPAGQAFDGYALYNSFPWEL